VCPEHGALAPTPHFFWALTPSVQNSRWKEVIKYLLSPKFRLDEICYASVNSWTHVVAKVKWTQLCREWTGVCVLVGGPAWSLGCRPWVLIMLASFYSSWAVTLQRRIHVLCWRVISKIALDLIFKIIIWRRSITLVDHKLRKSLFCNYSILWIIF
jgi:hypothetical protein